MKGKVIAVYAVKSYSSKQFQSFLTLVLDGSEIFNLT